MVRSQLKHCLPDWSVIGTQRLAMTSLLLKHETARTSSTIGGLAPTVLKLDIYWLSLSCSLKSLMKEDHIGENCRAY